MTGDLASANRAIDTVPSFSLTCNLIVPKQRAEGIVAVEVQPERTLLMGDTDTSGSIEYTEKLNIYVSTVREAWSLKQRPSRFPHRYRSRRSCLATVPWLAEPRFASETSRWILVWISPR